jgi:hypothetical protein
MAINFTRLFTALGKIVGGMNEVNTYRGTTLGTRANTLSALYNTVLQEVPADLYEALGSARTAEQRLLQYYQTLAQRTLVAEVVLDRPMIRQTLKECVLELRKQMISGAQSLAQTPATVTVTPTLTDGNAKLIGTNVHPSGQTVQLALPDTYRVTIPNGSLQGDTPFQEILALEGVEAAVPDTSWEWPGGSGSSATLTVRDANQSIGLANGKMSSLTSWTGQTGGTWTAGAATLAPRSGYTDNVIKFAPSGGSGYIQQTVTVKALRQYSWTVRVYKHSSGTQNWSMTVSLVDQTGTVVSSTTTAASMANGWNTLTGFFNTPEYMNGAVTFRVEYTSIVSSSNLEVCHAGFVEPAELYKGGPTLVAWAGTIPLTSRDKWDVGVTIGGTADPGSLHRGVDRLCGLRSILPQGLPVSGAPTQLDALVV